MEFDKIFNSEDVKDYNLFIEKLRQLREKGVALKIFFILYINIIKNMLHIIMINYKL